MLEPNEPRWQHGIPLPVTRNLKRRYYLVEKAKNASIIGIKTAQKDFGPLILCVLIFFNVQQVVDLTQK